MKKFFLVCALVAILGTGTAFAEHPDGFAIGLYGSFGGWRYNHAGGGGGLSLVIPKVPIYWGLNFAGLGVGYFGFGITGDYYLIDADFIPLLGWHLGIGGYFNYQGWKYSGWDKNLKKKDYRYSNFGFGVRVPIALHFHPIKLIDIWLGVAPSLGLGIYGKYKSYNASGKEESYGGGLYVDWDIPIEIGIRFWF